METKLLLLKVISYLYYGSYVSAEQISRDDGLLEKVLNYIEIPDNPSVIERDHNIILRIRHQALWFSKLPVGMKIEFDDLMTRIRVATGDNDRVYEMFTRNILPVDDSEAALSRSKELLRELVQFVAVEDMVALLRQSSRKIAFERDKIEDLGVWKQELMSKLDLIPIEGMRKISSISRCIKLEDIDHLTEVFELAEKAIDPKGMLMLHLKALNRMTAQGELLGVRRGDYLNVTAAPNNNKSGTLLDIFMAMCLFNEPCYMYNENAKAPLHVFVTIEDPVEVVIQKAYRILKQIEMGLPVNTDGISHREMAEFVSEKLRARGFEIRFLQFPRNGNVESLIADIQGFIDEGYEVHSVGIDYTYLIGKEGIPAVFAGDETPNLIAHIRAYTNPRLIFTYSAHQLSTEGRALARMYPIEYIQQLSGKGYFEGSKKTDNPFDVSLFVAKAVVNDQVWMQFQWDKRRGLGATSEKDKYFAVKFLPYPMIGIPYDQDKDHDISYPKIGARNANGAVGQNWDDF